MCITTQHNNHKLYTVKLSWRYSIRPVQKREREKELCNNGNLYIKDAARRMEGERDRGSCRGVKYALDWASTRNSISYSVFSLLDDLIPFARRLLNIARLQPSDLLANNTRARAGLHPEIVPRGERRRCRGRCCIH